PLLIRLPHSSTLFPYTTLFRSLDFSSAAKAIQDLGKKINMDAMECAAGICRIVELQMADVIRKVTVEKGFDPRDFVLFAFGGARSEEHTSELQSRSDLVCRLLL